MTLKHIKILIKEYVISDCKGKKLAQLISVKQNVWSFDLVSKVFLLSFLGFGLTFHHFLGNQIDIENSRERERERPIGRWRRRCEAWGRGGGGEGRIGEPSNRLRILLAPLLLLPQLPLLRQCCLPLFSDRGRDFFFFLFVLGEREK